MKLNFTLNVENKIDEITDFEEEEEFSPDLDSDEEYELYQDQLKIVDNGPLEENISIAIIKKNNLCLNPFILIGLQVMPKNY